MITIAQARGFTVAQLIAALSVLPVDALVLIGAAADAQLAIITAVDIMGLDDQCDREGEIVILAAGRYPVLSVVELPDLVEGELGDLAADLADL